MAQPAGLTGSAEAVLPEEAETSPSPLQHPPDLFTEVLLRASRHAGFQQLQNVGQERHRTASGVERVIRISLPLSKRDRDSR